MREEALRHHRRHDNGCSQIIFVVSGGFIRTPTFDVRPRLARPRGYDLIAIEKLECRHVFLALTESKQGLAPGPSRSPRHSDVSRPRLEKVYLPVYLPLVSIHGDTSRCVSIVVVVEWCRSYWRRLAARFPMPPRTTTRTKQTH